MNRIKNILGLLLLAALFTSCTKETGPLTDLKPNVPVTVSNAVYFRPEPTITTSLSGGGVIQITLAIPASSGRKIKEITKINASPNLLAIQGLPTQLYGPVYYYPTAVPVNDISYTLNTTLAEYFTIYPVNTSVTPTKPFVNLAAAANAELSYKFYFLITLDDGSKIIAEPVRVLVLA